MKDEVAELTVSVLTLELVFPLDEDHNHGCKGWSNTQFEKIKFLWDLSLSHLLL
jgi:hypothetical protein